MIHLRDKLPWFTVNFDSATGLVKSLGQCLHGKGFPGVGSVPESELLAKLINVLPWQWQRKLYVSGSAKGAIDPAKLGKIEAEDFSKWVTELFPSQQYPAMMIGSSSGPAVHLAAAMGIPWLPQTFLVPVKTPPMPVDDPVQRMEWARQPAEKLLAANPGLQLHHMMDPNQDRPMLKVTSYFRVKQLQLGPSYTKFIEQNLQKNGTLFIVDCRKSWPVTQVDDRHYFQFGGLGGTTIDEYLHGSDGVKQFLRQSGSSLEKWTAPAPDTTQPEAEWGFASALGKDIDRLAKENNYRVVRIIFDEPEDFSPLVADLYRWWYEKRGIPTGRLLAGMFFLVEPYLTLRTGSVPFWLAFNARPSIDCMLQYLRHTTPYDEIYMMPFSHGVKGMGLATESNMREVLAEARRQGDFIGSEPALYPFDFGIYARYEKDIQRKIKERYPLNSTLSMDQLSAFIEQEKGKYKVAWL